ncbi:MAG: HPr family phosphocarrier protein [Candidatus Krumholzibacteriia bacterium]|nr:HPr family phosphocarrier protein [Candidatus Latescibacterota bacterium]MCB9514703.1 HPr family phosphocarrier protein [Candidatus Latescibacterota bacterium]
MLERDLQVVNAKGLHLRAASELVKLTSSLDCRVTLSNGVIEVDGKSILGVAALGAAKGSSVKVRCDGDSEGSALDAITALFARGFYEDAL